jgi:hypothetical protein
VEDGQYLVEVVQQLKKTGTFSDKIATRDFSKQKLSEFTLCVLIS